MTTRMGRTASAQVVRRGGVGLLVAALGCVLTACTGSDDNPAATEDPVSTNETAAPPSIESSSTEQSAPPSGSGVHRRNAQQQVLDTLPGDPGGDCVEVGDDRDVRSGGFGAGPFDDAAVAVPAVDGALTVRVYWIPEHADGSETLIVRAMPESGGPPVVQKVPGLSDAAQWLYYDTTLILPSAGTWQLEASAGHDRGCFIAQLGER